MPRDLENLANRVDIFVAQAQVLFFFTGVWYQVLGEIELAGLAHDQKTWNGWEGQVIGA